MTSWMKEKLPSRYPFQIVHLKEAATCLNGLNGRKNGKDGHLDGHLDASHRIGVFFVVIPASGLLNDLFALF